VYAVVSLFYLRISNKSSNEKRLDQARSRGKTFGGNCLEILLCPENLLLYLMYI